MATSWVQNQYLRRAVEYHRRAVSAVSENAAA